VTLEALFVFSSTPCLTAAADQTPLGLEITAPPVKRMRPSRRRLPTRVSLFLTFRPWSSSLPLGTLSHIKWVSRQVMDQPLERRGVGQARTAKSKRAVVALTRPHSTARDGCVRTEAQCAVRFQRQNEVCREGTAAP